jgi:nitric oxide reductase NorQ protein
MTSQAVMDPFRIVRRPNYVPQQDEEAVFRAAREAGIPLILKGPTGCGKTRFVEYMAHILDLPLVTVSCHEDLTAADLVGRFLLKNDQTIWQDGPLTLAVRYGGLCYLDEIVEARKDTTVIIHSLTDDRRVLYLDKTGAVLRAHPDFMMILSYNPGYQSIVKDLKQSTKQRFASIAFSYPSVETEAEIIRTESGLGSEDSRKLAEMGAKIRQLKGFGLDEGASTRLLVYVARLIRSGLPPVCACTHAISQTLTEEADVAESVQNIARLYFGELLDEAAHAPAHSIPP